MNTLTTHGAAAAPTQGYFAEDCPTLASRLDLTCESIAASAAKAVHSRVPIGAIVLGGGYGRGEGGVWRDASEKNPDLYNDLDFFLFSDRPGDVDLRAWVKAEEDLWTERLGIHVDFAILPPQVLDGASESMMLTDLVMGYRSVFGAVKFVEVAAQYVNPSRLPLWEATRLLWNRGSGLFFARCRIAEKSQEAGEFVERNQQKLALALGDALLCLAGEHDPSVSERGRRFAALTLEHFAWNDDSQSDRLHKLHRQAVAFKMRPRPVESNWDLWRKRDEELAQLWGTVFLCVEEARLGRNFADLSAYANDRQRLVPETSAIKNLLISIRDRKRYGASLKPVWDYPRGTLMRCLAAIHGGNTELANTLLPAAVGKEIPSLETCYTNWWDRYQ
jgi:hypothetical protein